jgi:hypothetical protein
MFTRRVTPTGNYLQIGFARSDATAFRRRFEPICPSATRSAPSMRCQRSSGNAQSVKIRALSAIGLFVLCLINQENKADADSVIKVSAHIANHNISRVFSILR